MGKKDYDVVSRLATTKRKMDSYERTARTSFGKFLTEDIRNASAGRFTDDRKRPKRPLNEQETIQKLTILQLKQQLVDNNIPLLRHWKKDDYVKEVLAHRNNPN
jgi:hypothetical protein